MSNNKFENPLDIDKFGAFVDKHLTENNVELLIRMPKGTMEPEIISSFQGISVMEFYIMLHALKKIVQNVMDEGQVDPKKKGKMINGMLKMVKDAIMEEG